MNSNDRLNKSSTINKYRDMMIRMLSISRCDLPLGMIEQAIDYSIRKRFKDAEINIENNYKKMILNTTLLDTCDYIDENKPIFTSSGVLFQRHEKSVNLIGKMIDKFLSNRKVAKKEMFKYERGTEEFAFWNLKQLLAKRDTNAIYGAMGQYSCILYNIFVAEATTTQGRSMISSSILFFEAFLANNVKFSSLNDIITFIDNVITEDRVFDDSAILDRNISNQECFTKIMSTCGFNGYVPTEEDMEIVWDIIVKLHQEDVNRLYYKNNLYAFFDNTVMRNTIKYILSELKYPFLNPNELPEEIIVPMTELYKIVKEYVYYSHQVIDKLGRVENMMRDVSIIIDTDSTIVSFDSWYKFILSIIDTEEIKICKNVYRFTVEDDNDKLMKVDVDINGEKNPDYIYPEDTIRYSIINIISNICGKLIIEYMYNYASKFNTVGVKGSDRDCRLIQKNEFLFKRAIVSEGKKHYADKQEIQEGKMVPNNMNSSMAIMGLEMMKSTLAKQTQQDLREILYNDILDKEEIDQVAILEKLKAIDEKIRTSIMNGERIYLKPSVMKSIDSYDDPMKIQPIKGSIVYNKIRDEYMAEINMNERCSVDILKVDINTKNILPLKESNPHIYEALVELLNMPAFKTGISAISFPPDVNIPKWMHEYIDFDSIVNGNLKPFPIETIGLPRMSNNNINYTNIIQL